LGSWNGLFHLHTRDRELGAQLDGQIPLPAILALYPVANVKVSNGTLKFSGQYGSKVGSTNASADVALADFTGTVGTMEFKDYQARLATSVDLDQGTLSLQRLNLALQDGFKPGGSIDVNGRFELKEKTGKFDFKSVDLNQNALAPFVAAAIAPNRLVSIELGLNGGATFDLKGESRIKGGLKVSNFLVDDPAKRLPASPLGFGVTFEVGQKGSVTDIKSVQVGLGPTALVANELVIAGKLDLGTNAPSPSSLSLRSDGLDFTALYNLFAAGGATNKPAAATIPGKPAAPGPMDSANVEPAPLRLPFQQFDLDVNLAQVHLREVAISNWVTKATVRQGVVTLDPFSLSLNGAPITARGRFDLNVPGYVYDLTLNGDTIPIPPLVNSFQPERNGQVGGTAVLKAAVKGAGITGAGLERNLNGTVEFGATGLNLKLGDVKSPLLKTIVNVVIGLPELIRSPGLGTLGKLTGLGGGDKAGGWVDEFSQSPISAITARAVAGGGKVDLQQAEVLSPAFQINAKGTITFDPVLTNSVLEIPVGVALKDSLAKKVGLTSTGAAYTPMPDFLTVKGTLGVPKPDIAYSKLALLAGKAGLGIVGGTAGAIGEKASGLFKALGGGASTNDAPAETNSTKHDLLDLFKKPKN
ncbi:MAG TPA: AsmA family protein, partial [Candidatus Limnocylindria bacterium]|nr:AsmA family protein [Candidatus Limnocylindria bacterium]